MLEFDFRYVDQKFTQSYRATVGADFMEKEVMVDGKVVHLEVSPPTILDLGHCRPGKIQESGWSLLQRR